MSNPKPLTTLAAAEHLCDAGFPADAASRYYYAMYQAAVARLTRQGVAPGSFQSGALRWEHATVANNARRLRGRTEDRRLYHFAMRLRVRADYHLDPVSSDEVAAMRAQFAEFVNEMVR